MIKKLNEQEQINSDHSQIDKDPNYKPGATDIFQAENKLSKNISSQYYSTTWEDVMNESDQAIDTFIKYISQYGKYLDLYEYRYIARDEIRKMLKKFTYYFGDWTKTDGNYLHAQMNLFLAEENNVKVEDWEKFELANPKSSDLFNKNKALDADELRFYLDTYLKAAYGSETGDPRQATFWKYETMKNQFLLSMSVLHGQDAFEIYKQGSQQWRGDDKEYKKTQ